MGKYNVQSEFEFARKSFIFFAGLELSLTEQVILRKLVSDTVDEVATVREPMTKFRPAVESAVRFLMQEYGITLSDREFYGPLIGGYPFSEQSKLELKFMQWQRNLI
jgi:hypothetical protein